MNEGLYKLLEEFNKLEEELITLLKLNNTTTVDPIVSELTTSLCESVKIRITTVIQTFQSISDNLKVIDTQDTTLDTNNIVKALILFKSYQVILRVISKLTTNVGVLLPLLDILTNDVNINSELSLMIDAVDKLTNGK